MKKQKKYKQNKICTRQATISTILFVIILTINRCLDSPDLLITLFVTVSNLQ